MYRSRLSWTAWIMVFVVSCTSSGGASNRGGDDPATRRDTGQPLDFSRIQRITGIEGTARGGEYKIAVPQRDLSVSVDGFRIIPPMGLTSWAAFTPAPEGAMVMGDLVVRENEIAPVQEALIHAGMTVTGLHNHFVRARPAVMFMHVYGRGRVEALARGVRAALDAVKKVRAADGLQARSAPVAGRFDPRTIDRILGRGGKMNAGVYKVTIGRPDVSLAHQGVPVGTFMGFNTWMAFQGTADKAAVAGDFVMLEGEVAPVIEALVTHHIEVVAVHNHMTYERPRVFFLHFWGTGPVAKLAEGLRAGLDHTGLASTWTFDADAVGTLPPGWSAETTNPEGAPARWSVRQDASAPSGDHVLALTDSKDSHGGTFNVCWTDSVSFQDGTIEVRLKPGSGQEDQGGGPMWRVQDRNNYYVARWNPLEDNFRLYYVKDGRRRQLATARVKAASDRWHAITIRHKGTHIEGYLDGKKWLEQDDTTFTAPGGIGVWTKADAATSFDDVIVK